MHRTFRLILTTLPLILAPATAGTHVWTGAISGFWSDPLNWTGGTPQPGEPPPVILRIPAAAASHRDLTNDVPGLTVNELLVAAHANTLHAAPGVRLGLKNATLTAGAISTIFDRSFRIELEGSNRFVGAKELIVRGPLTEIAPGTTLDIEGNVRLETSSAHSGPTRFGAGEITLHGSLTNTTLLQVGSNTVLTLAADFSLLTNHGHLNILAESQERPQTSRLHGNGFVCAPGSTTSVLMLDYPALDSTDPADGARIHSHLAVDGPVVLGGRLRATTDLFIPGLRFTILENAGTTPTLGEFDNLPEGALMTMTERSQTDLLARISYHGGDGNDVTLTLVEPPPGGYLAGPWLLENGWLQILGGIREFHGLLPHRWESTHDPSQPANWTPFGPEFIPMEHGALLTVTNAASLPQRFFRLALPNL